MNHANESATPILGDEGDSCADEARPAGANSRQTRERKRHGTCH